MQAQKQTATIAGLVAFINAQPAQRTMDHMQGWNQCAVGHYSTEVLGRSDFGYRADGVVKELVEDDDRIVRELQFAYNYDWGTYGKLRTALAERYPDLGIKHPKSPLEVAIAKMKALFKQVQPA